MIVKLLVFLLQKYDIIRIKILFCLYFNTFNRYNLYKLLNYFFFSTNRYKIKKSPIKRGFFKYLLLYMFQIK
ncbi:hypothetical protein HMPREF1551_00591 [Capnocytophaga sp. oral taxon 863 str. F0517]|nr:hypothetical protein HMPREF1551_00591 [Capnocytophaga sp. oral taxon 863 str. F0517]